MGKLQVLIRDSTIVRHARASNFTLRALKTQIYDVGPVPREHGLKGHKAYNAYPFEVVSAAAKFIKNYASVFGLPQPAASRGRANQAPLLTFQPTRTTSLFIKSIGMPTFYAI